VVVVKLVVWLTAIDRPSYSTVTAIVRLATAIDRPSYRTRMANVRLATVIDRSSSATVTAIDRPSCSTAIARLATAIEQPPNSTVTAIGRLSMAGAATVARRSSSSANAKSPSSGCDAIGQAAMWMMTKMKMRKTRKMMMKIRVEDEGGAAGEATAIAAVRSARNDEQRLRRSRLGRSRHH
jgi:hypothetical protein